MKHGRSDVSTCSPPDRSPLAVFDQQMLSEAAEIKADKRSPFTDYSQEHAAHTGSSCSWMEDK